MKRQELSGPQALAAQALAAGATITDAATAADVARQTVGTWLREDTVFIAAVNQLRTDAFVTIKDKLRLTVGKALDVVSGAVDSGDLTAALAVLKLANIDKLPLTCSGPTDPTDAALDLMLRGRPTP